MPTDKEILYNMLDREVDNLLRGNPMLTVFSSTIKQYVHNFLDPYLSFFMEGETLQMDVASAYAQEEVKNKIDNFKNKFFDSRKGAN